jgi:hypothetical protein
MECTAPVFRTKESINNFLSTLKKRELRDFETAVEAQLETSAAAPL